MGGYWNIRAREALSTLIEDKEKLKELVPLYGLRMFLEYHHEKKGSKPISTENMSDAVREGFYKVMQMKSTREIPEIQGSLAPRGVGQPASREYVDSFGDKAA